MSSSQLLQQLCNSSFPHKQCSEDTKSQRIVQNSATRHLWVISGHNHARRTTTSFATMDRSYIIMTSIRKIQRDVITAAHVHPQPGPPVPPPNPSSSPWKLWAVGMLISAALSFGNKFSPLMMLKKAAEQVVEDLEEKVDEVLEKADKVLDKVEEVAEKVEKVADELEEQLPEGGKLRETVTLVKHLAEETAKDAQLAEEILEKVEEVEEEIASLLGVRRKKDQNKKLP